MNTAILYDCKNDPAINPRPAAALPLPNRRKDTLDQPQPPIP
ncbi:MAG TPA: hypothetical protein VFY40_24450 [Blastocatellia bacterium]|nr:hypothetical protein [Blastocatellia bacterium]